MEIDKEMRCWDENSKKNVVFFCKYEANDNKLEDNSPFVDVTDSVVNLGEYNYKINIVNVYKYFQNIKLTSKTKIIYNLENIDLNNDKNFLRDLLALADIFL